MNLTNLKELATDIGLIAGIPCFLMPCDIIAAPHIKLEYLGETSTNYTGVQKTDNGTFEINLILRAEGFNESMLDRVETADTKIVKALTSNLTIQTSNYKMTFNQEQKPANIGWQFPEQAIGITEPDPANENSSSRMIFTRLFPMKINYSKIN